MTDGEPVKFSRRDALRIGAAFAAVAVLSGCRPQSGEGAAPTPEATKTPSPMGMKEFDSEAGKLPSDALKDAFVAMVKAAGREDAEEFRDFYDEWLDHTAIPTINVMTINYNNEGQVTKILYANHWKGFFGLVDDGDNDTGVSQEVNAMCQGKGIVLVAHQAYVGAQDCHKSAFEQALTNLAPDAVVIGAVIDVRTGSSNVIKLDGVGPVAGWMKN